LQRVLVGVVTRRIVFARHEHAQIRVVAILKSAADSFGVPPHYLGEVAAGFWRWGARESFEIVPVLLHVPVEGSIGGVPMARLPPEDVLAVVGVGVDEFAILVTLHEVLPRVGRKVLVPSEQGKVVLLPYPVMCVHELLSQQRLVREGLVDNRGDVTEVISGVDAIMGGDSCGEEEEENGAHDWEGRHGLKNLPPARATTTEEEIWDWGFYIYVCYYF